MVKTNVSMSVKSALSIVASVAMLGALYVAPANALTDTNLMVPTRQTLRLARRLN